MSCELYYIGDKSSLVFNALPTAPSWRHGISLLLWLHENLAQPSLQDVLQSSSHHLRLHSLALLSLRFDYFPYPTEPVLNILNSSVVAQVSQMVSSISSQPKKMSLKSVKKCARIKLSKKSASPGLHRLLKCCTKWRRVHWRSLFLHQAFFLCLSAKSLNFALRRVSLEAGGNAPFIVFADANIEEAVEGAWSWVLRGSQIWPCCSI